MRYCRFFIRRPLGLFVALAALPLAAAVLTNGRLCATAFAAPPVAAPAPVVLHEWKGELPTPPQQTAPWTPPVDSGLPAALLDAARLLFDQGLADPRGGEYQTITVHVGNVWNGGNVVETHGWVLPQETNGQKFAVCWNGLVYPVAGVKGRADLDADVRRMLEKLDAQQSSQAKKADGMAYYVAIYSLFSRDAIPEADSLTVDRAFFLKSLLLLRLNKPRLARTIAVAWEKNATRNSGNTPDEARRDPYGPLAAEWAWTLYDRAVCAHMRGADALALADTNLLTRVQPRIEAETAKRAYKTYVDNSVYDANKPYLDFLKNLPDLQKDTARRVAEGPRPPVDWAALKKKPQAERIAFLISRLDDVAARQSGQPGGVDLDDDPIAQALINEGSTAVEPLFDAIERDKRITRSVSYGRDFFRDRQLHYVSWAASACVNAITQVSEISDKNGTGRTIAFWREWWAKNKDRSPADRWYAQLSDDGPAVYVTPASPGKPRDAESERKEWERLSNIARSKQQRWEEAARNIVERTNVHRAGMSVAIYPIKPGESLPPYKGESLRARTNPSVSDLLRNRALQLSEPARDKWGFDYAAGATFALRLYEWDPRGAQTLSTLQEIMRRCLEYQNRQERGEGHSEQYQLAGRIARLTLARVYLGDDAAAKEYEAWLRTVTPEYLGFSSKDSLLALWREPENPALKAVADRLFAEKTENGDRATIWSRLLISRTDRNNYFADDLIGSDLLRIPAFQDLVVKRLTDRAPTGFVTQKGGSEITRQYDWNVSTPQSSKTVDGNSLQKQSLRTCDRVAVALRYIAGCPPFDPLAAAEKRDTQCAAITSFIQRWGTTLHRAGPTVSAPPLYSNDFGDIFAYLGPTFRVADRPATEADVRENRAIFHLRGQKTRVAPDLLAALPIEARWDKDPNPIKALRSDGKVNNYSSGLIWQAEDEWNGKTWVRYYGYVGPHGLYKVPASEIELSDWRVVAAQKAQSAKNK